MCDNFLAHKVEWHRVEILQVAHFYTADVKTHNGRIVANKFLGVRTTVLIFPGESIEWVILVSEHVSLLADFRKT